MNEYEFAIICNHKSSWDYICSNGRKRCQIEAENVNELKMKVLAWGLPWDDEKVPKPKPFKIEGIPAQFRLPWCKSNYKRY